MQVSHLDIKKLLGKVENQIYSGDTLFKSVVEYSSDEVRKMWCQKVTEWIDRNIRSRQEDVSASTRFILVGYFNSQKFKRPTRHKVPSELWFSHSWIQRIATFVIENSEEGEIGCDRKKLDLLSIVAGYDGWHGFQNDISFVWNEKSKNENPEIAVQEEGEKPVKVRKGKWRRRLLRTLIAFVALNYIAVIIIENAHSIQLEKGYNDFIAISELELAKYDLSVFTLYNQKKLPNSIEKRKVLWDFFSELTTFLEDQYKFEQNSKSDIYLLLDLDKWEIRRKYWSQSFLYKRYLQENSVKMMVRGEFLNSVGVDSNLKHFEPIPFDSSESDSAIIMTGDSVGVEYDSALLSVKVRLHHMINMVRVLMVDTVNYWFIDSLTKN